MNDLIRQMIRTRRDQVVERLKVMVRFDEKNLFNNLPYILLVSMLGVLHVASNHSAERKIRTLNRGEDELKELRWTYMTKKADLMLKSRQSEVADMVRDLGLEELDVPPGKIVVPEDRMR